MMRRTIFKVLAGLLALLLALYTLYGLWAWFQGVMWRLFQNGRFPIDILLGRWLVPQTIWFYGALTASFLLVTIALIWLILRLIQPGTHENER